MSYAEALQWQAYRMKYGSLNVAMRLELEVGQLRAAVAHALGSKESVYTFLPHVPRPETKPQTFEEVCAIFMSVAPRKQKDAV